MMHTTSLSAYPISIQIKTMQIRITGTIICKSFKAFKRAW